MELLDFVKKLEGRTDEERKDIIIETLKRSKYNFFLEDYKTAFGQGVNIIMELGSGEKEILVTCHYDAVPGSPGANDNASAIAVVLDVYKRLKDYELNNKIKLIIFGSEEPTHFSVGLIGSHEYVKKHRVENIKAVYSLELCGMGDVVGIWPVEEDIKSTIAFKNLEETLNDLNIYFEYSGKIPGFYSDYKSFRDAGLKDSLCLTAVLKEEKDKIRKFVEMDPFLLTFRMMTRTLKLPKLFQHYHSPDDKSIYLTESCLRMMSDVVYNAVINLDKI
ncbi:MAG: M28 family peptidase [Nanoarchaeota archaeon]|nr:M28 family peptidase [DPANN group archaeon]MBL7116396.1 M28 family peptidase [Nanoarchaeota archaeon]